MRWILALLFVASAAVAQERTHEQIMEATGLTKEEIFRGTKAWVASTFTRPVIDYEHAGEGVVITSAVMKYPCSGLTCLAKGEWKVPFTLRVDMKEGRLRMTFTNVGLMFPGYHGAMAVQGDWENTKAKFESLGPELVKAIAEHKAKANW